MNIGIYIGNSQPNAQTGGGYTFQESIITALSQHTSKHNYYIFHDGTPIKKTDTKLTYIPLQKFASQKTDNILKKIYLKILRKYSHHKILNKYKSFLNKAALDNHIDIMWFVSPAYRQIEIPFIYTVWDLQHRLQPYFPEVSVSGSLFEDREKHYASVLPKATYIITGNQTGKQEIMTFYNIQPERIKALEFPTPQWALNASSNNATNINTAQKQKTNIFEKYKITEPYLFYPAQFWPHKNHIALVQALYVLRTEHKLDFSLVFTGSDKGNLSYIKQKVREYKLENHVHFLGFVPIEELTALYQNAFALTFASFFGPNNIPPLEAFGLGCPVIAAQAAGMQEQLQDAALFFDPKNAQDCVHKILELYNKPELRETLITRGKTHAQRWTAQDYIKQIDVLFDEFVPIRACWSSTEKYIHK
ncbi:MAG: glycosyltransferase family 1 protein [bacterium]